LQAAVADAKKRGVSQMFCAGDITGYGPFPNEVCDYLQESRIAAIAGNYDEKVLTVITHGSSSFDTLPKKKQMILLWTAEQLSQRSREYLSKLPHRLDLEFPGQNKLLVVHGSPLGNDDDILPSITARGLKTKMGEARADILVCGHTHIPFVKKISKVLVVNCGSVGQPVDGDTRLAYAIINLDEESSARARIVRVDYELKRTLEALKKTSLPKRLRQDYALGTKRMFMQ
jgi:putative phosphoesterase